jgi:hypothetical protein
MSITVRRRMKMQCPLCGKTMHSELCWLLAVQVVYPSAGYDFWLQQATEISTALHNHMTSEHDLEQPKWP